jgi:hypothetical protein
MRSVDIFGGFEPPEMLRNTVEMVKKKPMVEPTLLYSPFQLKFKKKIHVATPIPRKHELFSILLDRHHAYKQGTLYPCEQ